MPATHGPERHARCHDLGHEGEEIGGQLYGDGGAARWSCNSVRTALVMKLWWWCLAVGASDGVDRRHKQGRSRPGMTWLWKEQARSWQLWRGGARLVAQHGDAPGGGGWWWKKASTSRKGLAVVADG